MSDKITAVVLCAGSGKRCQLGYNKLLHKTDGKTILENTVDKFLGNKLIDKIIITSSNDDITAVRNLYAKNKKVNCILGGQTRFDSVFNALKSIKSTHIVLIHDGARPYVTDEIINNCIDSAKKYGSGIASVKAIDTIAIADKNNISEYINRDNAFNIQTPQAFDFINIFNAYTLADKNLAFTDDSSVYLKYIGTPHIVEGSQGNYKITYKEHLEIPPSDFKIGTGYDVHRLVKNRELILGGVKIDYSLGLLGHSDADVLTHSIMDSLLSAINKRDIGYHFPDTDKAYKNADSIELLKVVNGMVRENGFTINNISCIIICQKPKLSTYIDSMQEKLASVIGVEKSRINITATTNEGLSKIGKGKAIATQSTALLYKTL